MEKERGFKGILVLIVAIVFHWIPFYPIGYR